MVVLSDVWFAHRDRERVKSKSISDDWNTVLMTASSAELDGTVDDGAAVTAAVVFDSGDFNRPVCAWFSRLARVITCSVQVSGSIRDEFCSSLGSIVSFGVVDLASGSGSATVSLRFRFKSRLISGDLGVPSS
ncbi:hypothetical protein Hdeb2414_s0004g00137341 [Helianthus debilis subsp. tardiflorus]